ncbi:hypothetical protein Van01_64960 [Micromonospora andamanensis]|uniref:Uncharacterized protein n=1 Tax=Micromonospora andamanensis TaxID=1287068 RepID=A0ABQ4I5X1_9ACTN|nr:hypothetical protein Van01_64960 [Micromonospora andamanensis]
MDDAERTLRMYAGEYYECSLTVEAGKAAEVSDVPMPSGHFIQAGTVHKTGFVVTQGPDPARRRLEPYA